MSATARGSSVPSHRIPASQYSVYQRGHRSMRFRVLCICGKFMCGGGIAQDPDNLFFWQDIAVIQCQKQRLADGEGSESGNLVGDGHGRFRFLLQGVQIGTYRNPRPDLLYATDTEQHLAQVSRLSEWLASGH